MKWLGYLSKLLLSVLLISWLSVFTTAYIVDLYINQLIAQWGTGGMNKPTIDAADYVSKLVNPSRLLESEQSLDSSPTKETDTNESDLHSPEDPGLPVFNQETPSELDQDGTENQQQAGHLTSELNDEQSGTSRDPSINSDAIKDTLVMSAQEFNEKRKKLSQEDKTEIFSIVITKLPQKELQKMSLILEDGITEEELVDLEDVINAYLEHEEVEKLLTILNKY